MSVAKHTYSNKELINSRSVFESLLKRLGIKSGQDRIHHAYNLLEKALLDNKITEQDQVYAGSDILDLIKFLEIADSVDNKILHEKVKRLLKGSLNRDEESANNTFGRDTQFELLLLSDLKTANRTVELCDPHPDLEFVQNGKLYCIEAKRIFSRSEASVKERIHEAAKQLDINSLNSNSRRGIIALSVDVHVSGAGLIIDKKQFQTAKKAAQTDLSNFLSKYENIWRRPDVMVNPKIVGVLVYFSVPLVLRDTAVVTPYSNVGISHTLWSDNSNREYCKTLHQDLSPMLSKLRKAYPEP